MEPEVQDESHLIAYRDMVRDLVVCRDFNEWCNILGLTPSSPDVDDREHRESHLRLQAVQTIAPDVAQVSALAGNVVHNLFTAYCEDSERAREDFPLYMAIATQVAHACVVYLVDKGKLKIA